MVTIGIEFKDLSLLPQGEALQKFVTTTVANAIIDQLNKASGITRAADPAMDERGVSISIGVTF